MKKLVLLIFLFTFGASAQRFVATYNTIAELLASPPPGAQTNAIVLGRNSPNDNGGDNFYYDKSSSAVTNLGTIFKPNSYNGRWLRVWDYSEAKPEWFGAKIDDGVDDQPAIQAALNVMWSLKTGIVKLSAGKYHIATPIRIPYRGVLKGVPSITYAEGSFDVYTNSFWMAGGSSHIRLMNGANCKMVILAAEDDPNAYVRQANETLEDGSVGDAHFQFSLIEDIVFEGNPANQTEFNCHSIYAERKFSVTIRNCSFAFQSGCPIYFRDVNTGLIDNCYFQGSGTAYAGRSCFIYSSADCKIRNIWGFGNEGPLIWFNGDSSFVNECNDFMIGNSLITNTVWAASSVSTNGTWTFPAAIPLSTGDHVELRTTGTLPTPFNDTSLYFVYKVASNVFTLHTSMPSATNGTYLTPVGGSGTHSFTIGPASALYLSGGARHNDFTGVRCDQNSGPGITIRGAHYNTITGGILSQNYAAVNGESSALTESVGLRIEKDSTGNQVINVNARLQGYAYQLLDTCKSNLIVITSDLLTTTNAPLVTSSNQNNYLVLKNDLGNTIIGSENTQTALYLIGNASGQRVLKLYRHNVGYLGIGVHPQGLTLFNETNGVSIAQLYADASSIGFNLGTSGATSRLANINGEAGTGTDSAGGIVKINSGLGTGNGTPSQIQFYTPNTNGISGSTAQVYGQQRFKIDSGGTTFTDRLNLYSVISDPSDLVDGTAFYRSDTDKFRVRYNSTTANVATEDWVTANFTPGAGLADGDYTDITVSGTGTVMTIDNDAVTYAKMQNVSAASKLLGRGDSGSGDAQEITLGSGLTMTGTTLSASGGGGAVSITGTPSSGQIAEWTSSSAIQGVTATGSGSPVKATSPTLVTPVLGVASATSVNKVALTAPATGSTLTIADGKTLTANNTLTLSGTDGSTLNVGAGGTLGSLALLSAAPAGTLTGSTLASGVTASSLTSLGTITSGTWNGTAISVFYGGTGAGTFTDGGVLIGNGTSAIQSTSAGTVGQVLVSGGAGVDPAFGAVPSHNHAASDITSGTVATARLGSGTANSSTFLRGDQTWQSVSGAGDVVGPASATDAVPVLFDGTTGKLIKNSTPTGTGNPVLATAPTLTGGPTISGGLTLNGSLDMQGGTAGVLSLSVPNNFGTRSLVFPGFAGAANQVMVNDGANQLSWTNTLTDGDKGDITVGSSVTTMVIDNDVVSNAKMANMAASTIKARVTGSTGDPEDATLSQVLDLVGSAANGDILYRTGGSWTRLAKGQRGANLHSDGATLMWKSQRTHAWFIEDFIMSNLPTDWQTGGSGGGAAFVAGETGETGIYSLNTSTSSTGSRLITRGITSVLLGGGEVYVEWRAKIPTLGSGSERFNVTIGLTDQVTTPFDGAVFDYADNVNSGNWVLRTTSNGSSSTSNTSTAADTGWHVYGILVNAGATQVDFYIDDTNVGNITGTIPTGAARNTAAGASITKSVGSTQRDLYLGYVMLEHKFTTAR